jgi:CheY-like chemotaxis protein
MNIDNRKSSILIVDDNIDNLGLLSQLLSDRGHKVRKAINGKIALMGVRAEAPDLILLDILMPDIDGYEVCRQLKNDSNTASIPIIFLSALDEAIDKAKGFKVGGVDYIAKPFQVEEVLARVEHQLQIQRLQQQLYQQNRQLKEREAQLNTVLSTMSDGLIVLDRSGKVRFCNPAAPLLLDKTEAELLDRYFDWEIAIGETREIEIFLPSEAIRILAIEAETTTWKKEPGILLSLKDITQHKQAEVALKQAKETAEAASQAKSTFLSSVSHELRTPLHAILGFSSILAEENLTDRQQENLKIINKSGQHLQELIDDILSISKMEAGLVTLNPTTFNLLQFLNFIRDLFQQQAKAKGLQLIWQCDPNLPEYITSDRSKLRQVLLNLVGNAIAFTEKGSVTLRVKIIQRCDLASDRSKLWKKPPETALSQDVSNQTPTIEPTANNHQTITHNIAFEIEDTGIGIAEIDIKTIFDPFMQATRNIEAHQGTGLGLAISQKFVRLLGGEIKAQSNLNKGSLFSFMIPEILQTSVREINPEPNHYKISRKVIGLVSGQPQYRILIAEDDRKNRQLLRQYLQPLGFTIKEVENGAEAWKIWQEWQPHVILLDIQMPVIDGYEVTRRIRQKEQSFLSHQQPLIIIIALTAKAFIEDKQTSLAVGCNDYLAKPFQESLLLEKLGKHLHLKYIYQDESSPKSILSRIEKQDLQIMSSEWIDKLYQASLKLNTQEMLQLVEEIPQSETDLIETLKNLVNDFRIDIIQELTTA